MFVCVHVPNAFLAAPTGIRKIQPKWGIRNKKECRIAEETIQVALHTEKRWNIKYLN